MQPIRTSLVCLFVFNLKTIGNFKISSFKGARILELKSQFTNRFTISLLFQNHMHFTIRCKDFSSAHHMLSRKMKTTNSKSS